MPAPKVSEIVEVVLRDRYGTFARALRSLVPEIVDHLSVETGATGDALVDELEDRFGRLDDVLIAAAKALCEEAV